MTAAAHDSLRPRRSYHEWLFIGGWLLVYAASVLLTTLHHEPWRDEGDVWLAARDMSLAELFRWSHYTGTPLLWYLMVMPLAKGGLPYASMHLQHNLLAISSAGLILALAPFGRIARVALCFGYYLSYDYAVIARNYAPLTLLLIGVATLFQHRYRRPILLGVLLGLMANTSMHGLCIAGAVGIAWGMDVACRRQWKPRVLLGGSAAVLGAVIALMQVLPAPLDRQYADQTAIHFQFLSVSIQRAAFPFTPADWIKPRPGLVGLGMRGAMLVLLSAAITTGLAMLYSLRNFPAALVGAIIAIASLEYVFVFGWYGGDRHAGMLFLAVLLLVWILSNETRAGRIQWRCPPIARWIMTAALVESCGVAALFHYQDWRYAYSGSRGAAAYLTANLQREDRMIALSEKEGDDVLPYLPGYACWYPGRRGFGTFSLWNLTSISEKDATPEQVVSLARDEFGSNSQFVFLTTSRLDRAADLSLRKVYETGDGFLIHGDERFYIYRTEP